MSSSETPAVDPSPSQPTATPPAKPARKAGAAAAAAKPLKLKLVRDSFTMPELEYTQLEALKRRALGLAHHAKKSELLRAGVAALAAMDDVTLLAALQAVPPLKTGRPKAQPDAPAEAVAVKSRSAKARAAKTLPKADAKGVTPVTPVKAAKAGKVGKAAAAAPVAVPVSPVKSKVPKAAKPARSPKAAEAAPAEAPAPKVARAVAPATDAAAAKKARRKSA